MYVEDKEDPIKLLPPLSDNGLFFVLCKEGK